MDDCRVVVAEARRVDADHVRTHGFQVGRIDLASLSHGQGIDDCPVSYALEGHVWRGRVLLVKPGGIARKLGGDLGLAPSHLLMVKPEGLHVFDFFCGQFEVGGSFAAVLFWMNQGMNTAR